MCKISGYLKNWQDRNSAKKFKFYYDSSNFESTLPVVMTVPDIVVIDFSLQDFLYRPPVGKGEIILV